MACSWGGTCFDPAALEGNLCANPIIVGELPFETTGDTGMATNDLAYGDSVCEGETWGEGDEGNDLIYELLTGVAGVYTFAFVGFDAAVYLVADCDNVDTTCVAASETFGDDEEIVMSLGAEETYFFVVDGYSANGGEFELAIDVCIPNCEGKDCGDDGCGGGCGVCGEGEACDSDGTCVAAAEAAGNTCAKAFVVDALPYSFSGNVAYSTNDYLFGDGECAGEEWGGGDEARDQVFLFTPEATDIYVITVDGYDSVLYVTTQCDDIANTCVAGTDTWGDSETLELTIEQDTPYYIIVDGWAEDVFGPYILTIETQQE